MLLTILGWVWLITGILFLLKPEWLRNKLKKKSLKTIRRWTFAIALALSLLLIKATWGMSGLLPKLIFIFGLAGIFKAVFFLKSRSAKQVIDWFVAQPLKIFRMFAIGQIVFGAIILTV